MTSEGSVTRWIVDLQEGDDQAAQDLWERYYAALVRYARDRLPRSHKRVRDEEDVALSAFESFYKGVTDGSFPRLNDRDNLWRLLLVIAARKVVDHIDHECRQKRGGGRVGGESVLAGPRGEETKGLDAVIDNEPTPAFALLVAEQYERLIVWPRRRTGPDDCAVQARGLHKPGDRRSARMFRSHRGTQVVVDSLQMVIRRAGR